MKRVLILAPAVLATGVLATTVLAACGGGRGSAAGTVGSPSASASGSPATRGGGQRQFPGASGEIAAIDGATLQVQNTQSQTAVVYSAKTRITSTQAGTAADLKVGLCASVRESDSGATSVTVSQPENGQCIGMGIFGAEGDVRPSGEVPSGFPSRFQRPSRFQPPSQAPSGAPDGANVPRGAAGKIVSVSGTSFVVASVRFEPGASSSASPTPSNVTITTTASTTYRRTAAATPSALKVGLCATAFGTADDTGTIQATSISLRPKEGTSCTFGGPNG